MSSSDISENEPTPEEHTYKLRSRKQKGAKKKSSEPKQRTQMKKELYEKIRQKMGKVGTDSEESDSQEEAPESKKKKADKKRQVGNRNASKDTRRISIGWIHNNKPVRARNGGGTRVIEVSNDAFPADMIPVVKGYFFPGSISAKGLQGADCTFELRDFAHNIAEPKETVGQVHDRVQPGGKLRYHLYSSGPEIKSANIVATAAEEDVEVRAATQNISSPEAGTSRTGTASVGHAPPQVLQYYDVRGNYMEDGNQIILVEATQPTGPPSVSNPVINPTGPVAFDVTAPGPVVTGDGVDIDEFGTLASGFTVIPGASNEIYDTEQCRDGQSVSDFSDLPDLPTPRSPTPPHDDTTVLRIHRVNVQADMVKAFQDPAIMAKAVTYQFVDERGVDAKGLSREAYTLFWKGFMERSAKGEAERVPSVQPHYQKPEWQAVGRILLKGFRDVQVFPLQLSKAFVIVLLFGEEFLSPDNLMESFMNYISPPERDAVEKALGGGLDDDPEAKEEFLDMLTRMESETVPSSREAARASVMQLAQTELVQVGKYPMDSIISTARAGLVQLLPDVSSVHDLYTSKAPTVKKVINLFRPQGEGREEERATTFLKQYIKGLNPENLKRFLRHVTGCDMICVPHIEIHFNRRKGIDRVPVVRTCTPMIELPTTYSSYTELRAEFINIFSGEVPIDID